jgi:hypothetical protein
LLKVRGALAPPRAPLVAFGLLLVELEPGEPWAGAPAEAWSGFAWEVLLVPAALARRWASAFAASPRD